MTRPYTITAVLVCMIVAAGTVQAPAHAGKKHKKRVERVAEGPYRSPAIGSSTGPISICHVGLRLGCVGFDVHPKEKYARVDVEDALGQDVAARLYQYSEGGQILSRADLCTSTEDPLSLASAATWVTVFLFAGPCADGTPGMATTGVVTGTFSNLP